LNESHTHTQSTRNISGHLLDLKKQVMINLVTSSFLTQITE